MTFANALLQQATTLLARARERNITLCAAESCTGGLLSACFTEIPGSSDVFERAYITYSNTAKIEMLGVLPELIEREGAVSKAVACAMAEGARSMSGVSVAIAITGVAGPGGGSLAKPVGTVHFATASTDGARHAHRAFGDLGRSNIRIASVQAALDLLGEVID